MTEHQDNQTSAEAPNGAPASTESDETPPAGVTIPESGSQGLVEARNRYRGERDSAREERDALAGRVERMQRTEIERLAADALAHPSDLFTLSGNTPADYLTDDGDVDPDKVAADVAAVIAERPGLGKHAPAFDPSQGLGGKPRPKQVPTWSALLAPDGPSITPPTVR